MAYWMLDFTENERKKISLLESKETLTQDEQELLNRWNEAKSVYTAQILAQIQENRQIDAQNIVSRAYTLADALTSLENLANFYSAEYEKSLDGGENGQEQE